MSRLLFQGVPGVADISESLRAASASSPLVPGPLVPSSFVPQSLQSVADGDALHEE